MKIGIKARVLGVLATTTALSFIGASSASAWVLPLPSVSGNSVAIAVPGAYAKFAYNGDHWGIEDTAADGKTAIVQWRKGSENASVTGELRVAGKGETNSTTIDYPESTVLFFRACVDNASTAMICSAWARTTASG
ncbi:hypothetical protein [Streptodolium elevatio]|uniref:Uncharacterized protein n=1 Tax=Streptodolium elevatio TaxID=3157996 RepID=A0ABV3DN71_9ACTN